MLYFLRFGGNISSTSLKDKKKILVTHINAETGTLSDSVADAEEDHDIVELLRKEDSHSVSETSDLV